MPEKIAKIKHLGAAGLALLAAASWFQPAVAGSDLFWHLASGRRIWREGGPASVDPFSFTFAQREWMNHEWLWDAMYYPLYALHPDVCAWFHLALVVVAFWLFYLVALRASATAASAGAALFLAAAASHWFIDVRPHVWTMLLLGIVLVTRERAFAPWLWPPLVLIWANVHGGFVYGLGVIGLFTLVKTLGPSPPDLTRELDRAGDPAGRRLARRLVASRRLWIGAALAGLAMLINPWGYRILEYPLAYLDAGSPYRNLIEWRPPGLSLDPSGFAGRFFWISALGFGGAPLLWRRDPFLVLLAAVTFAMAVTSRRFIPLFALTSAPLVACALAHLTEELGSRWPLLTRPALRRAGVLATLALCAWLWSEVRLAPRLLDRWTQADLYPSAAVSFLNALGPPERLLNQYNWGGYLMLHAPAAKLWIDGRANTLYDDDIFVEYQLFLAGERRAAPRLARYRADAAILPPGGFARMLTSLPDPWVEIYNDGEALVLVPPRSPLRTRTPPDLASVLVQPELRVARGVVAKTRGDLALARRELEGAIRADPLFVRAYGELAVLEGEAGRPDAAAEAIARGIRADPRRVQDLRYFEGVAYERAGELARAVVAYRAARSKGPFGSPAEMTRLIETLEARLREGPQGARP